jgi:hypothetical protein
MADISYIPKVQFAPFFDNVSRVRAQGPDGFNVRFDGIKAEFDTLQTVVSAINDAITKLGIKPPPQARTATFTPNLMSTSADPNFQWQHGEGFATVPPGRRQAAGMMDIQLPNGAVLNKLRIIGNKDTGDLTVEVRRQQVVFGSTAQPIVSIFVPKTQNGTFDPPPTLVDPSRATVDNEQFRYYLVARVEGADPNAAKGVELDTIAITYTQ